MFYVIPVIVVAVFILIVVFRCGIRYEKSIEATRDEVIRDYNDDQGAE